MAVNVLVVFYSCGGDTERLALAAGVGAIQARANIRLRRLPPGPDVDANQLTPPERENFDRMSRDYTAPRPVDADWAGAVILAASLNGVSYLETYLAQLTARGLSDDKLIAPLPRDVNSLDVCQAFGREVVARAAAFKNAREKSG